MSALLASSAAPRARVAPRASAVSNRGVARRASVAPRDPRPRLNDDDGRVVLRRNDVRARASAASSATPSSFPSSPWPRSASHDDDDDDAAASRRRNNVVRKKVAARDFRHPLDQQNTSLLEAIPGLSNITKSIVTPVAEQMLIMEQISTSVLVGPNQLPSVHQLVIDAAEVLDVKPPALYIRQSSQPNAYTLAISGAFYTLPVVVVHTALVELMSPAELRAVIAHELGHLKCDHGVWLTVANLLTLGAEITPLVPSFVAANFNDELMRWVRAAELSCDRAALLVAGDPSVVVSVLMKLSGGCPKLSGQLNVDAFLDQARGYDEATASPLGWYLRNAQNKQLTHPLPVARAREIDKWARDGGYRSLGIAPAAAAPEEL
ncbi:uncharacterized protein MICPUCDRAFT_34483 [Micromonas pusilla CCMP1545]|uniref:Predicted protein n=1 Tax=Micromonas pusilla (strain CCMP1545) TaxID=564608 RepID=C1MYK2_MICPC|nr:uncharacterized protein MICPUCDRAFT_34483 [Micromonas pusilla CCMP1545]EEH55350.1 predicted protein [Micromonas pusilla CCMP1545]|eukprot:XP_003060581.1 predicted protein [Micromonas pusilla CCMP1545]